MSAYDKGFGGPRVPSHGQRHRDEPTRHGAEAHPPHRHGDPPGHGPAGAVPGASRKSEPRNRRWSRHAGRVGAASFTVGLVAGIASLIAWGNWAAVLVLPVLLGFGAWLFFWIGAGIADAFRRVR